MATPLSGFMDMPQKRSAGATIGRALGGFGAGLQGNGAQFMAQTQAQDKELSMERMKAMAQDAQQVYQLIQSNRLEDAIGLMDQRVQLISQLGGDPSDTLAIRQKVVGGDIQGAIQDLGMFLSAAKDSGLIGRSLKDDPSSVREYEYFNALSPEAQQRYLSMKRANPVVNLGDRTEVLNQADPGGAPIASLQRGVSPDNAPELRGQQAAAVQEAEIAAIPQRAAAETEADLIASQGQRAGALESRGEQAALLTDLVEQAKSQSGFWTTGFIGGAASKVAGTPAFDLARTLDTLQASAGFDTLQQMRDNSPTGGALGQVTERELALLQATWGSVVQAQSQEQFEKNLERFQRQVTNSWNRVAAAYERDYGEPYYKQDAPETGKPNEVIEVDW